MSNDNLVKKFRPFDLDAAMAGAKVITGAGEPVRIVCWDKASLWPLLCLVTHSNGTETVSCNNYEGSGDVRLFMAPVKVTKYCMVDPNRGYRVSTDYYEDFDNVPAYQGHLVATITWEE